MNDKAHDSLGFLIHDAARWLRREFEARGSQHGLSTAQWRLIVIATKEDGASQAHLAELLEIEPISVSRLVDRMEQAGWVERRPHRCDRRIRMVHPTPKAQEIYGEMRAIASEVYDSALHGLSAEDRAALLHGLRTVIRNLSGTESEAGSTTPLRKVQGQAR
jgi:DNA-binding MarR family transcriptional regulator